MRAAAKLNLKVFFKASRLILMSECFTIKGNDLGRRVRRLLEEAGGIFPKLGQNLADRPDLIPDDGLRDELRKLQHQCPTMGSYNLKRLLQEPDLKEVDLTQLNREPFASASIGQVHVLNDRHVIKLVNSDQERRIKSQEELVNALANANLPGLAGMIANTVQAVFAEVVAEFNLTLEAENTLFGKQLISAMIPEAGYFRRDVGFRTSKSALWMIRVPQVYNRGHAFMVMDNIIGSDSDCEEEKLNEFLANPKIARSLKETVLSLVFEAWGRMILIAGCFHCDPHGGNVYVKYRKPQPGKGDGPISLQAIWIIDWGSICELPPKVLQYLRKLIRTDKPDVSMLCEMGLRFPTKYTNQDKMNFAKIMYSSAAHSYEMKQGWLAEPVVPSELPVWCVQLLRVLRTFGAYANAVENLGCTEPWFHTDAIWKQIVISDEIRRSPAGSFLYSAPRQLPKRPSLRRQNERKNRERVKTPNHVQAPNLIISSSPYSFKHKYSK